ncbi:MAG: glutaminyl-peptide cyclotransferase, partial [Planctomycetes bacterium]|nr:glutaminyl-peptide cyclotransferase [Planctomycetota bacterium]
WCLGCDDESLWISDAVNNPGWVYQFGMDGFVTGVSHNLGLGGDWVADMAFDNNGYMLVVNAGGDNSIYRIDTNDGGVVSGLPAVPWAASQRGLAYDPYSGDLFVGGWNDSTIYRLKGFDSDNPGQLISSSMIGLGISGLAYHSEGSTGEVCESRLLINVTYLTNSSSPF